MAAIDTRSPAAKLRALLAEPGIMVAPGVFDGFSPRPVEQTGCKTAAITGAGARQRGYATGGILPYVMNELAAA